MEESFSPAAVLVPPPPAPSEPFSLPSSGTQSAFSCAQYAYDKPAVKFNTVSLSEEVS